MAVVLTVSLSVLAENTLTATEAKAHIGEQATVCGKVVSTRYAEGSHGQPTFLNFDQRYPKQVFTLLIWGDDARSLTIRRSRIEGSVSALRER
jgi:hypothetical protein